VLKLSLKRYWMNIMSDDIAVGLMIFVIGLAFVEWVHPGTTLAIYHMVRGDGY
jgi:hypothetical protein